MAGEERDSTLWLLFSLGGQGFFPERVENVSSLPVYFKSLHDSVLAFPMVHTHEESPLQSPLLNFWPEVWHLNLERNQMGDIQLQYL